MIMSFPTLLNIAPLNIMPTSTFNPLMFLLVLLFWLTAVPLTIAGNVAQAKILIVSSDDTVDKYRQVKDAFKLQITPHVERIIDFDARLDEQGATLAKLIKDETPDLIYSIGSKAYQLAVQYGDDRPVLFSSVINWQRFGRQGNRYGVANELSLSQELSLLRYLLPGLNRVGVLYSPRFNDERIDEARNQVREMGLTLVEQPIAETDNLPERLAALLPRIDVLWLIADPGVLADRASVEHIFATSSAYKKPVYTYSEAFAKYGASLVVSADTPTMGRQAATLAQSILSHEPVKETVQTPAGSRITLNACQLGKLNAGYNADALDAVNQLLECH